MYISGLVVFRPILTFAYYLHGSQYKPVRQEVSDYKRHAT